MKRGRYKRRGPNERFLMIPVDLLSKLPEQHMTVLIDMCKRHNGRNNGAIGYGWRDANKAAHVSRGGRILDDLRQRGIINLTRNAGFDMKTGRRTREWEIPFLGADERAPKGKRKLSLDHWLLNSIAFNSLAAVERRLLIELMRRYDGGNNGIIAFGVETGASIGVSRTRTSRALLRLKRLGFIVETAPANPQHQRPRTWRLTMYPAGGRPATKDFTRARPDLENSFRGCFGATASPLSAALVQTNTSTAKPISRPATSQIDENVRGSKELTSPSFGSGRAAQVDASSFTGAAHIEASQGLPRAQRASGCDEASFASSVAERSTQQASAASPPQRPFPSALEIDRVAVKAPIKRPMRQSKKRGLSITADERQGDLFPRSDGSDADTR